MPKDRLPYAFQNETMTSDDDDGARRKRKCLEQPDAGRHVLKPLLLDIRLANDDDSQDVHVECAEYWSLCIHNRDENEADLVQL